MNEEELTVERKALRINLDSSKYGTFAEIGAGQEVARHLFSRLEGAAGTVAKNHVCLRHEVQRCNFMGRLAGMSSRKRLVQMMSP